MENFLPFSRREEEILAFWEKHSIFKKTLSKKSPKGDFVFFEGPPTANGKPGIHHVLARAFKDCIPRFKTMQGYHVDRKAGWDTHGLPVELQVEKTLGLKSKPEIETYGIEKFNAECRKLVWQFKDEWEKLTNRIAFWLDLKHPYVTYENDYIESVWSVIAKVHERGLLYEGHKVVPFCTRCGTALSSHEVALGYKSVTEDSVYVKCRVTEGNAFVQKGDFILTWTTTPWTLPGNVALAVHPKLVYARVESEGQYFVLAQSLVKTVFRDLPHRVKATATGRDVVGVRYEPLFFGAVEIGDAKTAWQVVPADFVTATDGTGVVHTAVMYGEDDYRLGEEIGLPKQHTVGLDGKFLPHVTGLAGKYVKAKETEAAIYEHLKKTNAFFNKVSYTHDYPFCWRCDSPLLYYAKDSWFIAMTRIKKELLKNAEQINWVPAHIKEGRFGEWISGVKDWAISRERYWGTPMPVWQCQTRNTKYQIPNTKQISNSKNKNSNLQSGNGCGHWQVVGSLGELKKLAGKVPKDLHRPFIDEVVFPCVKCGGTMIRVPEVMDVWLDSGSMPYGQWGYPYVKKSHELLKAHFPADYICEAIDQTRGWFYTLLAISTLLGFDASYKNVICLGHINDTKGKKMSKHLGNVIDPWKMIEAFGSDAIRFYFYTINQPGESKNFDEKSLRGVYRNVIMLVVNIVSFYQTSKSYQVAERESTQTHVLDEWITVRTDVLRDAVTSSLEQYDIVRAAREIQTFINELSTWYVRRSRERFKNGDSHGTETFRTILEELAKLLAPFTPYLSEYVYQASGGKLKSVHLEQWPEPKGVKHALDILKKMEVTRKIVELGLAARAEAKIKIRQPLSLMKIFGCVVDETYLELVRDEINVKEVSCVKGGELRAELDTAISRDLELEGQAREFIRQINTLRKEKNMTPNDWVDIRYNGNIDEMVSKFRKDIMRSTLAKTLERGEGEEKITINGEHIKVSLKKIS